MKKLAALEALARHRTDEVVVTCMSVVRPWGRLGGHPLDFASADSAMGHTADFALGIALARPDRRVVCLNGDGSMLMTLGTLVTAAGSDATNFVLIVVDNGTYEITGNQAVPGAPAVDFVGLARASGFAHAVRFDDADGFDTALPGLLRREGPVLIDLLIEPEDEGPIQRRPEEPADYLKVSFETSARRLKDALQGWFPPPGRAPRGVAGSEAPRR
ncbi:MAG: thiamine pyrophosphate-binding protein [Gemmatimonadetes bacterium]|nr:thiamine pyrophosphate-binding protein [Gemmatimonadota bacterium]